MAYIIKRLLQSVPEELYWNTGGGLSEDKVATNIVMCNISLGAAFVYLSVHNDGGSFGEGAVVYGYSLAAGATLEIRDRVIPIGYKIFAFCNTAPDIVALSIDVIGGVGEFTHSP